MEVPVICADVWRCTVRVAVGFCGLTVGFSYVRMLTVGWCCTVTVVVGSCSVESCRILQVNCRISVLSFFSYVDCRISTVDCRTSYGICTESDTQPSRSDTDVTRSDSQSLRSDSQMLGPSYVGDSFACVSLRKVPPRRDALMASHGMRIVILKANSSNVNPQRLIPNSDGSAVGAVNREESGTAADVERAGFGAVSRCDCGNATRRHF